MKILMIPDIHQTGFWKKHVSENREVDAIVFLGDYFDYRKSDEPNLVEDGVKNFEEIMSLEGNIYRLIGNHDLSYIGNGACSSHQVFKHKEINEVITKYIDKLNIAVELDGWIFSHAGISKKYIELVESDGEKIDSFRDLNRLFHEKKFKYFDYCKYDFSGYGDSVYQTPVWIRPNSLISSAAYSRQSVGHTPICNEAIGVAFEDTKIIFTDTPKHDKCFVLDTEKPGIEFVCAKS